MVQIGKMRYELMACLKMTKLLIVLLILLNQSTIRMILIVSLHLDLDLMYSIQPTGMIMQMTI